MFELKPIGTKAIPAALAKAERYRLLNEPREAESISRDILQVAPDHQEALVMLLLALTDQFGKGTGVALDNPQQLIERLHDEYERAYYSGVILERWGKSLGGGGAPSYVGCDWLREAMKSYQAAEAIRPADNDDAILRWNTCARIIRMEAPKERGDPRVSSADPDPSAGDDVPIL
ncbi:MAG: hypothetical protein IID37_10530 [Planctomycetes bacterium]|nr:hypothetical protein [Planctomycetota bacterium]